MIAALRRQRLVVEVSGGPAFAGREDDLHSLLANLIGNAIRSAPVGGIVRCSVTTRGGRVKLEVADDGPGIPRAERVQVLRPFVRGTGADARDGGSGLGLAIVQRIVAEHQGRLTIATGPEGGALLAVELPAFARQDAAERRAAPTYAFAV